MFGMSGTEIAIILVLALLLLGPSRLPQLARTVGKGVRDFRRATSDIRSSVETEFYRMDEPLQAGRPTVVPPRPEGAPVPSTPAGLAAATAAAQFPPKPEGTRVPSTPAGLAATAAAPQDATSSAAAGGSEAAEKDATGGAAAAGNEPAENGATGGAARPGSEAAEKGATGGAAGAAGQREPGSAPCAAPAATSSSPQTANPGHPLGAASGDRKS